MFELIIPWAVGLVAGLTLALGTSVWWFVLADDHDPWDDPAGDVRE